LLQELEETTKRAVSFLVGINDVHLDHFRVIDQGTVAKLAPHRIGDRRAGGSS